MTQNEELHFFKETGFFEDTESALMHLRDADEILFSEGVDYCLMFGTLLGLLRHNGLIPWDDDIDIIIFDTDKFEKKCLHKFEEKGYVVFRDVRWLEGSSPSSKTEQRCGYRIYSEQGKAIPGQSWKFPWLGVWEPNFNQKTMTLPPEKFIYSIDDFFPLQMTAFMGFSVNVPLRPEKILKQYYGDDCMDVCMLHNLDHRNYRPTQFPTTKFPLEDVLAYLRKEQSK